MALRLSGKKVGMTQRFDKSGNIVVCSIIQVAPNIITQIKSKESDGYSSLQVGICKIETKDPRTVAKRMTKQLLGHYQKAGVEPHRHLAEMRVDGVEEHKVGDALDLSLFEKVSYVDVAGISKGKGFQGVMKRHGFAGGRASHGASRNHRKGGSTGMRSTPGRTLPGTKKAGRMGGKRVTVQSLKVAHIDMERNLVLVEGAIPGPVGGIVSLEQAKKKGK